MHSLFDRKAWTERLQRLNFYRIVVVVLMPLVWLSFFAIGRRQSYFQRILSNCEVACFIECWTVAAKGKLIDTESPPARLTTQPTTISDERFMSAASLASANC